MKMPVFCKIPWFEFYDGTEKPDVPECMNFLPVTLSDGEGGSHELLFGALTAKKKLPVIVPLKPGYLADQMVIFCADAPNGSLAVVGWYAHANVTCVPEILPMENENGTACMHPFFFCARAEDAVLLPVEERMKPVWFVPRNRSGNPAKYGFRADAVWLAEEPSAASYCKSLTASIAAYEGASLLDEVTAEENDADALRSDTAEEE